MALQSRHSNVPALFAVSYFLLFVQQGYGLNNFVTITVTGSAPIAQVDDDYICATLDWWPPQKCDYGRCSWGSASLLNLDLKNPILENAIKAFSPLKLRLGGSLQDNVIYNLGKPIKACVPFVRNQSAMFGFSGGCLSMWRWDALNRFFQNTGATVAFGLNALYGRSNVGGVYGPWNSTNARDLIQYSVKHGYKIQAWEFGNELSGSGVGTSLDAKQYAADVQELHTILVDIYASQSSQALLVAPDGFFDEAWYQEFLQKSGPNIVNVVSHHIYNLGAGVDTDLLEKILSPAYLDGEASTFRALRGTLQQYGPWASPWVGEAGGAYNSGHNLVTNAFVFGFWYLDQLGMAASFGTKSYCRQSLIGGNYGLLNTTTYHPNPDYYGALLWHRWMGRKVLGVKTVGSPSLRAYAHCTKGTGGLTLLLLNMSNQTRYSITLTLANAFSFSSLTLSRKGSSMMRQEFHLTA
eukprot:c19067_g2_i1 orf=852-2249(+)